MNKVLIVTSVASMVDQFLLPSMLLLQDMGYKVDVACNFEKGNTCNAERVEELKKKLDDCGISFYQIDFARNVFQLAQNKLAYGQLRSVITANDYKLIHCHSPIGGLLGRLAARSARKKGTRVFYTAHGFHFYKGAPLKNWLFYYPVEKVCSYFTDVLITINQEDYALAKKKMKAKKVAYVPGVGIDLDKFQNVQVDRAAKRKEIGVPEDAFLLFSVGELNENKNHQVIIKAMAKLNNPNVHYAIAGVGDKKDYLLKLADELGVSEQLHLLGYRKDIPELNHCADVFCFPSFREGLSVSLMEAMASRLPCVVSRTRGNVDLIDENGGIVFEVHDEEACISAISSVIKSDDHAMGKYNEKKVREFGYPIVVEKMRRLYFEKT